MKKNLLCLRLFGIHLGRHDRISASSACLRPTRAPQRFTNSWGLSINLVIK